MRCGAGAGAGGVAGPLRQPQLVLLARLLDVGLHQRLDLGRVDLAALVVTDLQARDDITRRPKSPERPRAPSRLK